MTILNGSSVIQTIFTLQREAHTGNGQGEVPASDNACKTPTPPLGTATISVTVRCFLFFGLFSTHTIQQLRFMIHNWTLFNMMISDKLLVARTFF